MQIGMIGLGRMGANMALRLLANGHQCVVFDAHAPASKELVAAGAEVADSLEDLVKRLSTPRAVWMMLPAAIVDDEIALLAPLLGSGDVLIDGGNSYYKDDIRRGAALDKQGISMMDVGTSGGTFGRERGYCLMIGGDKKVFERLEPIFVTLAPGDGGSRAADATGTASDGYLYCGPHGAGHFVKMVHNGIEYGLMAAYAEGLDILRHANIGKDVHEIDAETTPLREPELYQYDFDLPQIAEVWRRGSVISSWLLDLTAQALKGDPDLGSYAGHVSDSGEGRWTIMAAIDEAVPAPVLSAALYARFNSRGGGDFANRVLSAMRHAFGGHVEKPSGKKVGA